MTSQTKFVTRLTDPYLPITAVNERQFPHKQSLSYNTYLIAVKDYNGGYEYNFVFSDNTFS